MEQRPGTYALVLSSRGVHRIRIGRLGELVTRPGFYVYVGSAFGPGGIRARVARHGRECSRPHWHIDYLRPRTRLEQVWYSCDPIRREHQWAHQIARARGSSVPLGRFGSSDCRCPSHLYFFESRPSRRTFSRRVHAAHPGHEAIGTAALVRPGGLPGELDGQSRFTPVDSESGRRDKSPSAAR
jgi:Uri superfamily endonuclease